MNFALGNHNIEKYFGFLFKLDKETKKSLISRLTDSINNRGQKKIDIHSLYGAWDDDKSSDEIIHEIRTSRIDKNNISGF